MTKKTKLVWKTEYQARYVGKSAKVRYQFNVDKQGDVNYDTIEDLTQGVEAYLPNIPEAMLEDFSHVRISYYERVTVQPLHIKFRNSLKTITRPIPTA